jgi:hypothetical protein
MSARLVTLDRNGALTALQELNDDQPTGLAKVRVEAPRPILAVVLRLGPGQIPSQSGVTVLRHPITLQVDVEGDELTQLESWAESQGVSLLTVDDDPQEAAPTRLPSDGGVELRHAESLAEGLLEGLVRAEQLGAAWVYGELNRPTLGAVAELMRTHGELVHLVGFERIVQPSTAPWWRRRCASEPSP